MIAFHRVAAALCAASFAVCCAGPALAADPPGPDAGPWQGRGMMGHGPEGGPHGFGGQGPGMHGGMGGMHGMHGMLQHLQRLNLSEAQRDKLFAIMHAAAPEHHEHMKVIRRAHEALAELAHAERFDDAKAAALSRELGQAVAAQALLQARTASQALAVLTPEQRDQLRRHRTPGPQIRPGQPGRPQ